MGRFEPGNAKPSGSGRKRGTPNRKTLNLEAALKAHGLEVIPTLAGTLPELDAEKRAQICVQLLSYLYPKRKSVELEQTIMPQPQAAAPPREKTREEIEQSRARTLEKLITLIQLDDSFRNAAAQVFVQCSGLWNEIEDQRRDWQKKVGELH